MTEVVTDGHTNTKDHTVGVALEHGLHVSLGLGVETLIEIGNSLFGETNARSEGVGIVIFEDTSGGVDGAVDVTFVATVGDVECTDDVGTDGIGFVILAPINVGTASNSSGHEDVGGFDLVELLGYIGAIFDTRFGKDYLYVGFLEEDGHFAADPAGLSAEDESFGEWGRGGHC